MLVLGERTGDGKKRGYTSSLILGVRIGGSTSMPILAAVPAMILIADSTVEQFKSGNFSIAMVRNWSIVTFPTFSSFGSFEPFSAPAKLFRSMNQLNKLVFAIPTYKQVVRKQQLIASFYQENIKIAPFNQNLTSLLCVEKYYC